MEWIDAKKELPEDTHVSKLIIYRGYGWADGEDEIQEAYFDGKQWSQSGDRVSKHGEVRYWLKGFDIPARPEDKNMFSIVNPEIHNDYQGEVLYVPIERSAKATSVDIHDDIIVDGIKRKVSAIQSRAGINGYTVECFHLMPVSEND